MKTQLIATLLALSFLVGLFVFSALKIKKYFQFKLKLLKELGIFYEKKKQFTDPKTNAIRERIVSSTLKIRKEKNNIIISKYNPKLSVVDFAERLRPNLEHILQIKIEDVSTRKPFFPWRQQEIVICTESFKESLSMDDCPQNLVPGQYWLGRNARGEDKILDLKKGDFSLGIFSLAGGGKGNAITAIVSSFLDTWIKHRGEHYYRVIFLDAKGTDYINLLKKYPGAKSYNPIYLDELKEVVQILEEYKKEVSDYRKYLAENEVTVSHWLNIESSHPGLKPQPRPLLLIADEVSQYCTPRGSIKITKDSSEEQLELKEIALLEEKLASLINTILQLHRSSSVMVLIANQTLKQEELTLQRTNIINFLLGRNTSQMSRTLLGSDLLIDTTLKSGRFIFSGNGEIIKIQVPFVLRDNITKSDKK